MIQQGAVLKKTCKLCGKRRLCRMDEMRHYYMAEASTKLIPVCIAECSTFGRREKKV